MDIEKEIERMKEQRLQEKYRSIAGFQLMLEPYCANCPNFEAEVEKLDCATVGATPKTMNNIRCQNERRCVNIAENMKGRV